MKPSIIFCLILITALFVHSQVIKTIDFENEPVGQYTETQLDAAWNSPSWNNGISEGRVHVVEDPNDLNGNVLRVYYPEGGVGPSEGGAQWKMDFDQSYDTLYVSYKVMVPQDFDRVKGGKLPGLAGGTAPTGGADPTGTDGFSARIMWRDRNTADGEQTVLCQYVYYMESTSDWGDDFFWAYPNPSWSSTRRYLVHGQWHTLQTRIIMNTPGLKDGKITSWLDGELAMDSTVMLKAETGTFGIDLFYFSTFFGGNDTTWAPSKDEYIYFDDFIFSTQQINDDQTSTGNNYLKHSPQTTHFHVKTNHTAPGVTIQFNNTIPKSARLNIFTCKGQLVESFDLNHSNSMASMVIGSTYSSGSYFAVLKVDNRTVERRDFTISK